MKEPVRIRLNPETPTHKDVNKIPMPSVYKPEWDITGQNNDDLYIPVNKNDIGQNNENNSENNSESIQ